MSIHTITCPICGQPHALFWKVPAAGKAMLKYRCNKVVTIRKTGRLEGESFLSNQERMIGLKGSPETRPYEKLNIPETWTITKAKRIQKDRQPEFPL